MGCRAGAGSGNAALGATQGAAFLSTSPLVSSDAMDGFGCVELLEAALEPLLLALGAGWFLRCGGQTTNYCVFDLHQTANS